MKIRHLEVANDILGYVRNQYGIALLTGDVIELAKLVAECSTHTKDFEDYTSALEIVHALDDFKSKIGTPKENAIRARRLLDSIRASIEFETDAEEMGAVGVCMGDEWEVGDLKSV